VVTLTGERESAAGLAALGLGKEDASMGRVIGK